MNVFFKKTNEGNARFTNKLMKIIVGFFVDHRDGFGEAAYVRCSAYVEGSVASNTVQLSITLGNTVGTQLHILSRPGAEISTRFYDAPWKSNPMSLD